MEKSGEGVYQVVQKPFGVKWLAQIFAVAYPAEWDKKF